MSGLTRREWLQRTALITAIHAPLLKGAYAAAASDVAPVRFQHIRIEAQPLDAMRRFYADTFGFPIVETGDDRFTMKAGDSVIEFVQAAEGENPFYHFAFSISENKIELAREWTAERTPVLKHKESGDEIIHFKNWNAHAMYFADPAGNIGEFIAHHTLDTAKPGDFSLDDVLYTSEIGLVVDDVHGAVEELKPITGVKDVPGASRVFAAVGDARGFFILVRNKRRWLPEFRQAAEPHPVHIEFHTGTPGPAPLSSGPYTLERKVAPA